MKKIAVLSPIIPEWCLLPDYMTPFYLFSEKHPQFYFEAIDCLSFCDECETIEEAKYKLINWLEEYGHQYEMFMGFAMGGTLLQLCSDSNALNDKRLTLFSSPTYADSVLSERLGIVVKHLEQTRLDEAIALVEKFATNLNNPVDSSVPVNDRSITNSRLLKGYQLILQADAREAVMKRNSRLISAFVGEDSALATLNNVTLGDEHITIVPNAGMRLFADNMPFMQNQLIKLLLERT